MEIERREDELERMRAAFMELQKEYSKFTQDQINNIQKSPSNLNFNSGSLPSGNDK